MSFTSLRPAARHGAMLLTLCAAIALIGCGSSGRSSAPPPTLSSLAVTPGNPSVALGKTQQMTATGTYSNGSTADLTTSVSWVSSDPNVLTVTNTGLATTVAMGSATVTATSGSIAGHSNLTVTTPVLVSINVTATDLIIDINTTAQFTATGIFSNGSSQDLTDVVTWSAPGSIASIDNTGLATGLAIGTVTVNATSGSINGTADLQVTAPTLVSILISPLTASVPLGIRQTFTATGVFSNGDTQDLASAVWNSSDSTKVSIDATGNGQTLATGTVTVTATYGSVSGNTTFTVLPAALVSIALNPSAPSIALGTTVTLTPVGTFTDGSTQTLSPVLWNSSDPTIASVVVNGTGLVSSNALGTVQITATSGSISGSSSVTVTNAVVSSIAVTPPNPTIPAGLTQQFTAIGTFTDSTTQDVSTTATWTSSNGAVASVSNSGLGTALSVGSSNVTATLGSVSGFTVLTVGPAVLQSITLSPQNATVGKGTTVQFTATGNYSDSSTQDITSVVTWSSSDSQSVSIDNTGLATARKTGTVTISAALGSVNSSTNLTVNTHPLVSIVVTPVNPSINVGQTQQFTATGTYSDGSTQDLTKTAHWSSSSSGVATINNGVSGGGLSTGQGAGTATITASFQGVSGSTSLTVN